MVYSSIITAICEHGVSGAAQSLGISRQQVWRVLQRLERDAADPSPIHELKRRRSMIHMVDLSGEELRNASGVIGYEPSLRRERTR